MIIGYIRVSRSEQNFDRQADQLQAYGCEKIYSEKASGANADRVELSTMLEHLRQNDIVVVTELSRISRSVRDLFKIVDEINRKGANIKSLKESWIDTTTPQGQFMFTIFAGVSEFERELIRQRVNEGIQSARMRGRKGGRPKSNEKAVEMALRMYDSKSYSITEITKATGLSKATLYNKIRQRNN